MLRRAIWPGAFAVLAASALEAPDEKRVELGLNLGYTGSNGISSDSPRTGAQWLS